MEARLNIENFIETSQTSVMNFSFKFVLLALDRSSLMVWKVDQQLWNSCVQHNVREKVNLICRSLCKAVRAVFPTTIIGDLFPHHQFCNVQKMPITFWNLPGDVRRLIYGMFVAL